VFDTESYRVTVTVPESAFADHVYFRVIEMQWAELDEATAELLKASGLTEDDALLDIGFEDADGFEVEPDAAIGVSIEAAETEIAEVYHVEDAETVAKVAEDVADVAEFTVKSFSIFAVAVVNNTLGQGLEGKGTEAEPYLIEDAADLNKIGTLCETAPAEKLYFRLENDVTVSESDRIPFTEPIWSSSRVAVVTYLKNAEFDGNGKTIRATGTGSFYIFGDVRNSTIKDLTVEFDGGNASMIYYTKNATIHNVTVSGSINWTSSNSGAFVIYLSGNLTMTDCTNAAALQMNGDVTAYDAVFCGYSLSFDTLTFTNCVNTGSLRCGKASMFLANWSYGVQSDLVISNCKNHGLIYATLDKSDYYNSKYNYITSDYWDKAGCLTVKIDGGDVLTSSTPSKWYDVENQSGLIGTGHFVSAKPDATLDITKGSDDILSVIPATIDDVAYYVVSVGTYVSTLNGSNRVCATIVMLLLLPSGATAFRLSIVVAATGIRVTVQQSFPYGIPNRSRRRILRLLFFCAMLVHTLRWKEETACEAKRA